MQGGLWKKGRRSRVFGSDWRERHFVLLDPHVAEVAVSGSRRGRGRSKPAEDLPVKHVQHFTYFESHTSNKPLGHILLEGACSVSENNARTKTGNRYIYTFAVDTPKRVYELGADSQSVAANWAVVIRNAIKSLQRLDRNDDLRHNTTTMPDSKAARMLSNAPMPASAQGANGDAQPPPPPQRPRPHSHQVQHRQQQHHHFQQRQQQQQQQQQQQASSATATTASMTADSTNVGSYVAQNNFHSPEHAPSPKVQGQQLQQQQQQRLLQHRQQQQQQQQGRGPPMTDHQNMFALQMPTNPAMQAQGQAPRGPGVAGQPQQRFSGGTGRRSSGTESLPSPLISKQVRTSSTDVVEAPPLRVRYLGAQQSVPNLPSTGASSASGAFMPQPPHQRSGSNSRTNYGALASMAESDGSFSSAATAPLPGQQHSPPGSPPRRQQTRSRDSSGANGWGAMSSAARATSASAALIAASATVPRQEHCVSVPQPPTEPLQMRESQGGAPARPPAPPPRGARSEQGRRSSQQQRRTLSSERPPPPRGVPPRQSSQLSRGTNMPAPVQRVDQISGRDRSITDPIGASAVQPWSARQSSRSQLRQHQRQRTPTSPETPGSAKRQPRKQQEQQTAPRVDSDGSANDDVDLGNQPQEGALWTKSRKLRAASLSTLLDLLVNENDSEFSEKKNVQAFLLQYKTVTTAAKLFAGLCKRYFAAYTQSSILSMSNTSMRQLGTAAPTLAERVPAGSSRKRIAAGSMRGHAQSVAGMGPGAGALPSLGEVASPTSAGSPLAQRIVRGSSVSPYSGNSSGGAAADSRQERTLQVMTIWVQVWPSDFQEPDMIERVEDFLKSAHERIDMFSIHTLAANTVLTNALDAFRAAFNNARRQPTTPPHDGRNRSPTRGGGSNNSAPLSPRSIAMLRNRQQLQDFGSVLGGAHTRNSLEALLGSSGVMPTVNIDDAPIQPSSPTTADDPSCNTRESTESERPSNATATTAHSSMSTPNGPNSRQNSGGGGILVRATSSVTLGGGFERDTPYVSATERSMYKKRDLAKQLCLIEQDMYQAVRAEELLNQAWTKGNAPNIRAILDFSNELTRWTMYSIVVISDNRKRRLAMRRAIKLAHHCLELRNFSSAFSITVGLKAQVVHRLRQTWAGLPSDARHMFAEIETVTSLDSGRKAYRERFDRSPDDCTIPFLGYTLAHLVNVDESEGLSKDYLKDALRRAPNSRRRGSGLAEQLTADSTASAAAAVSADGKDGGGGGSVLGGWGRNRRDTQKQQKQSPQHMSSGQDADSTQPTTGGPGTEVFGELAMQLRLRAPTPDRGSGGCKRPENGNSASGSWSADSTGGSAAAEEERGSVPSRGGGILRRFGGTLRRSTTTSTSVSPSGASAGGARPSVAEEGFDSPIVNVAKQRLVLDIIDQYLYCQQRPYTFSPISTLQTAIWDDLASCEHVTEDVLYDLSFKAEARGAGGGGGAGGRGR